MDDEESPKFDQVILVSGHMIDQPDRAATRFPPSAELAVTAAIRATLRAWAVGSDSLLISGGAKGTDMIAAEQALLLGATVWLLVARHDDAFIPESVDIPGTDWTERYLNLRRRCRTLFQEDELGPPAGGESIFERNNDWFIAVANRLVSPDRVRALVVWDGLGGDGPGGTSDFVERMRRSGADVAVIHPRPG